jgi:broad specificity phosphatase PhoE
MKRCLFTARAVASSLRSYLVEPVRVKEDLFEDGGCYTRGPDGRAIALSGSTSLDIQKEFPDYICPNIIDQGWFSGRDVETEAEFIRRIEGLIAWLWKLHEEAMQSQSITTVVLVAHGNVISCLLSGLLSGDPRGSLYCLDNTGHAHVELFDYEGRRIATCQAINNTAHLRGQRDLVTGGLSLGDLWIQDYVAGFGVNESTTSA